MTTFQIRFQVPQHAHKYSRLHPGVIDDAEPVGPLTFEVASQPPEWKHAEIIEVTE
jgi:hypothetical protein